MKTLTQTELKEHLHYNPETGVFTWITPRQGRKVGQEAGTDCNGYRNIRIGGRLHYGHRLAWLYVYGEFPAITIDHINQKKSDNRIANLRDASYQLQRQNSGTPKNNKSGIKGVAWVEERKKWRAFIKHNRKQLHFGYHATIEEAAAARKKAERDLGWCERQS